MSEQKPYKVSDGDAVDRDNRKSDNVKRKLPLRKNEEDALYLERFKQYITT